MANNDSGILLRGTVDWWSLLIYLLLVLAGWCNIYAAAYDESHPLIFDLSQKYGMQMVWIGVSLVFGLVIMLLDDKYYHILAIPLYAASLAVLLAVLFVGKEVHGAKSWIMLGKSIALQPTELVKITTALALARTMSTYTFSVKRLTDLLRVGVIVALPVVIILLQNDTGSAVVYGAFLFVLYREGLASWIYTVLIMVVSLFVFSFLLAPPVLLGLLLTVCVAAAGLADGEWRSKAVYLAAVAMSTMSIYFGSRLAGGSGPGLTACMVISAALSLILVLLYAYRNKVWGVFRYVALFGVSLLFTQLTDVVFNHMQPHQQERILHLFGIENDLQGAGFNVNQSKIAIGSGGFAGKGFLEGTQTKYNFVPEQSTDFIFCTVGEEWGFMGSAAILVLFCILIYRLMKMGERQQEPFGRIYCYSAAAIFFVHVFINVGMTIGIMPVIGIPLPFFSYGGSSMLAFSLLFFIALRLDASKHKTLM